MAYTIPPALHAILADADRVAPGRSHASDGTIGDAAHRHEVSDHNPDGRGIVHAVDVTNDPAHGMNTWTWAQVIAVRIRAGLEHRVKYLVSNNGTHDVIFDPAVSLTWRLNNAEGGQSHRTHLHTSILSGSGPENDTRPYFVGAPTPPKPHAEEGIVSAFVNYPIPTLLNRFYVSHDGHLWQAFEGPDGAKHDVNVSTQCGFGLIDPARPVEAHAAPNGDLIVGGVYGAEDHVYNEARYIAGAHRWQPVTYR